MRNILVFYLVKQFYSYRKYDLGHCQYQNKKALFTDPIFSDGFARLSNRFENSVGTTFK
jgi:hypothetical protein